MAASPTQSLVATRIAIGTGAWATPNFAGRLFGLDPKGNPQSPYLARLFGVRDVALGAGLLGSDPQARKLWLRLGIACDVADAAAAVLSGRSGALSRSSTVLTGVTALVAAGLGVAALAETDAA